MFIAEQYSRPQNGGRMIVSLFVHLLSLVLIATVYYILNLSVTRFPSTILTFF